MSQAPGAEVIGTLAAFIILLGALVFVARPGAALNRVLGALLLLHGGTELVYHLMRTSASPVDMLMYHRVGRWYESAVQPLMLFLLHYLVPPASRARWRWWALGGAVALALLLSPLTGLDPTVAPMGSGSLHVEHSPWTDAYLSFQWAARGIAVGVAAYVASSASRSALQRQQASLVGLAFIFLLGYSTTYQISAATVGGRFALWAAPSTWVGAACLATALLAIPRLAQPFAGRARTAVVLAALVPFAAGPWQFFFSGMPWYLSTRLCMIAAYTACLSIAIVRYDLMGMGPRVRRRMEVLSRGMLAFAALMLPAGFVLLLLNVSSRSLVLALVMATGAVAISPAPARVLARAFTRVFAPDPADPSVAAERARLYAAGIERHNEDASALAKLRGELRLQDADHDALVHLLGARESGHAPRRGPPLLGRYVVERELGRGATGTALLARDLATRRRVVLKCYHTGQGEKHAQAEAQALTKVRHPRVVPLLSVERAGGRIFLVLEYADGGTAAALIADNRRLDPPRATALALDVLEGLEAIHATGLAHGDVKLGNILLDAEGRALLADLGASQALARAEADLTLTTSPVVGTYATVAPEILRGARRSAAADVYATGAVLYRLLTREDYVHLRENDVVATTNAILGAQPRLPHPLVPSALEPILARALAKAPADRYAGAREMRADLARAARALEGRSLATEAP